MTRTMAAKFPGTCTSCRKRFPAGAAVVWTKGVGARHASAVGCADAVAAAAALPKPAAPTVSVGEFAGVIALFERAKAYLKYPKITLLVGSTPVILMLAGPRSKTPGSVTIVGPGRYPDREYYGRVSPDGVWTMNTRTGPGFGAALGALLTALAVNPAKVAAEHGKLTAHCCFCNTKIGVGDDPRSLAVGFGPTCAEHYGLTAEWKTGAALAAAIEANVVLDLSAAALAAAERAIDVAPPEATA
jgi:hypothetical protein